MSDPQSFAGWIQVAEVNELWRAELIAGRLRESGIDAQLIDQTFHQEPVPKVRAFAVVRVFVPKDRRDQAERLIAEGLELPDDAELVEDEGGNPQK